MMSQRKSPDRAVAERPSAFESGSVEMPEKFMSAIFYVSHIGIYWVQCYKIVHHGEILDRFAGGGGSSGRTNQRLRPSILLPSDCRATSRQTYWTSRIPPQRKPA